MPTLQAGGDAHGGRHDSNGLAILYRLAASVMLRGLQIPPISKLAPIDLDFECPVVAFKF